MDTTKDNINSEKTEDQIREDAKRMAIEKVKQSAVIVNIDDLAEAEARKAADAHMTESKESLNGIKGFFKKIWKHTFFDEYYRQKEVNKVREDINRTGDIYTGRIKDSNKVAHENTMQAISDRFASEYEGTLNKGEDKKNLDEKNPESLKAKNEIKNLINDYAKGILDEEAFQESKARILNSLNKDSAKASHNYADNLFEIAKNARIAIEHGVSMEELDLDTNIILGKAKSSLSTEAHYNNIDKAVAWTKKSSIGRFLSPAVVSTAIGIGYSVSIGLGKKVLRSKVAAYGTFGAAVVFSSAFAGMNESQRLAAERAQHGLEMAEGAAIGPDSKRREKMEEFQYKMESSESLSARLRSLMFVKDEKGRDIVREDINQADLDKIFTSLAEIDARKSLNAKNKIDLISYSNIGNVEKESTDLTILVAKAKVELRKRIESDLTNGLPKGETSFDSYLAKQTQAIENSLLGGEKGIDASDKAFSKFKTNEVAKKVLKTAVIGLVAGGVMQEAVSFFKDDVQGFFEGMFGRDNSHVVIQTPLEHLRSWITGHSTHMALGHAVETHIDGNNFKLPEGTSIIQNEDCTYNILRGDQVISDHIPLTFDEAGNLDDTSIAHLGEDGIVANTTCTSVDGTKEITTTAKDWVNSHLSNTTHITRSWMGNNTPMYPDPNHPGHLLGADLNELRTQWAGINGTGIDEHGDYVMTVQHMTNDGSFQDGVSVAAHDEMLKGKLEVLLSVTKDTQTHVIKGIIGTDGLIHFNHEDQNIKMLFENVNGHAQYDGAFIEIAKHNGDMPDGREMMQILSTHIGTDHARDITDILPTHTEIPITNLDLPLDTEPPYFIPLFSHTPLEPVTYKDYKDKEVVASKKEKVYGDAPYGEKNKEYFTEIKFYRNTDAQAEELIKNLSTKENLKGKYDFISKRLELLKNYNYLPPNLKSKIEKQAYIYNHRHNKNNPLTATQFVDKEIKRLYAQTENIYIENAKVGEKPFEKSFYENAPMLKGLEKCKEVVIVLDDPMGDGILTLPIINSINKYFELNGIKKNIKVIARKFFSLYKSLEDQYPNVQVLSTPESELYFKKNNKDLFILNTNGNFDDYEMLGIGAKERENLSRVFSCNWASWQKEESPIDEHSMTKYDPLPSRIARSFEIMLGQKLFENIKETEKYLEKSKNFEKESKEIKKKYNIKDKEKLIVISVGSSASPKEYSPEKWKEVIDGIYKKYPETHILVLNDPDPIKRAKYGTIFDEFSKSKGYKISHSDEGLSSMNTIMSMADTVITPDTGLGHYASALGTKTIMMYLSDPVLWSAPGVKRVIHKKGYETYKQGIGLDSKLWGAGRYGNSDYLIDDRGVGIGASDINAEEIISRV